MARGANENGNENRLEICSTLYGQDTLVQLKDDDSGVDDGGTMGQCLSALRSLLACGDLCQHFGSVRYGSARSND